MNTFNEINIFSSVDTAHDGQASLTSTSPIQFSQPSLSTSANSTPKMTKRTCARCKESNRCVKLLCSRIDRIEDLVNSLASRTKFADEKDRRIIEESGIPRIPIAQENLTTDLSRCSTDDILALITNFYRTTLEPSFEVRAQ
ncbi:6934_t:CDS:2 [Acaulospora morrowiae]|uniref:6934_t:CDS:1 n=1 Tax=Acaulospora morrowiae TaxID=94023 RepID=A0A9N8Z8W5_9GLOM|nr:6934_t:CDS:2 [Acaulospora morrowiae]